MKFYWLLTPFALLMSFVFIVLAWATVIGTIIDEWRY